MWQVLAYTLGISVAFSLAGFCGDRLSSMMGRSRRFIWAATMLLSILWPLGMMLWAAPLPHAVPVAAQGSVPKQVVMAGVTAAPIATPEPGGLEAQAAFSMPARLQGKWRDRLPSDQALLQAWAMLSGVLLLSLAGTDLFLHCRSSRWRRMRVLDRQVLVSESTGPALLGAWRPKIVVPRWFLDEKAATQSLILEHERQHIAARDPLLLRMALLTVAAVPWNLPLWWQLRRLRQAIELDCDARVLRNGAEAGSYGEVLLAVTQRAGNVPAGAIAMGEPVSALEQRIQCLTRDQVSYSGPRALATVIFCAAGIGVAFALDAPALPRSPEKVVVRHDAPVAMTQPAQGSTASPGSEASGVAREAAPPSQVLSAAQAPALPRESAAQSRARVEGTQALPRLLPPTPFSGPPLNPEDPRSDKSTQAAVLAARPDIESEYTGTKVLTVFMTEEGKIDRSYVIHDTWEILGGDFVFPAALTREMPAGIIPELVSKRWEPLGLRPEQLGHMGITIFDNKNNPGTDSIYVLYAWPRRPGEPIGGFNPYDAVGWPYRSSFTYADAVAVVEHYLPGSLDDKGGTPDGTPWLLLSPQGEVVSSGYQPASRKWARFVMEEANPGRRIGLVLKMTDKVIIGWLEPEQSGK